MEQTPEHTLLRYDYEIPGYGYSHAVAGMRDREGNITVVSGECQTLEQALAWYSQEAARSLTERGRGTTKDIVRAELLRSL